MSELNIHEALERQYRAALRCFCKPSPSAPKICGSPLAMPISTGILPTTLFSTRTCTCKPRKREPRPWAKHQPDYQYLGSIPRPPYDRPKIEVPYSQADILEFHEVCRREIESRVRSVALDLPSGFSWLRFDRLEVHLYNIRHLQHHTGQLIDRLRTAKDIGVAWVGAD